jgi:hypothetical protein
MAIEIRKLAGALGARMSASVMGAEWAAEAAA